MNKTPMNLRDAVESDAAAICTIYNQGIEDRDATLETELRTPGERARWLGSRGPRHPVLLAEREQQGQSQVLGWGSLNPFNPRPAYDGVVDFSIYIRREARGQGVGAFLLTGMEARARDIGFHKMVLAMFDWNTPGVRLYQRHGFCTVGVYREQGVLDGRWVDVMLMEKLLSAQ